MVNLNRILWAAEAYLGPWQTYGKNGGFPVQAPQGARTGTRTQPRYDASGRRLIKRNY